VIENTIVKFMENVSLLLILLNPFLIIIYLIDVVRKQTTRRFVKVISRAGAVTIAVLVLFALLGDAVFDRVLKMEFASFQIFGGIVILIIALQYLFKGPDAIAMLRGDSDQVTGAIAMPIMIGPGTISGSIVIGQSTSPLPAALAVALAIVISILMMILIKLLHDKVKTRHESMVQRYIEVVGRIVPLVAGTIAIEMVMIGAQHWAEKF
jgi:multiple antibiotic resistance protein